MKAAIEKIKVTERIRKEITKIPELANDINKNGLLHPVIVMSLDGGEYKLLAGLRRLRAAEYLGRTEIDVNLVSPADAESALHIEISENEQREQFTYSEKMDYTVLIEEIETAKARERMLAGKSADQSDPVVPGPQGSRKSRDAIGAKIGMSGKQYDRAKYIAKNATPEIIDQLDRGERSIRPTYDELRAKEKAEKAATSVVEPKTETIPQPASPAELQSKTKPGTPPPNTPTPARTARKTSPMDYMSKNDIAAIQKLKEFDALPPEGKIEELKCQLKDERVRAVTAESELADLRKVHNNAIYHKDSIIDGLKSQLAAAHARIEELEKGQGDVGD